MNKKYKLTGEQLVKKIKRESLTVDDLIEHLVWFKKEFKKSGWHLPLKIQVVTYNDAADKSCTAILDSWTAGGNTAAGNKDGSTLTLIALSSNPDLVVNENW